MTETVRGAEQMAEVLVAMSGGVDSSAAAAILVEQGHDVVGVTLKLWGGESDSGCCSVADVTDARRVAHQLGIEHHVFNFSDEFDTHVVEPYVAAHQAGRTPNPCIECNRHLKFDRLMRRADALGFELVATGHHVQVMTDAEANLRVGRGTDAAKDQSYVLYMLGQDELRRLLFPVGDRSKDAVRALAAERGLLTATKADSQDVCFIEHRTGGRSAFLGDRIGLRPGRLQTADGEVVGHVPAAQLVTIGQRKGLNLGGNDDRRYVTAIDHPAPDADPQAAAVITVGPWEDLLVETTPLDQLTWSAEPVAGPVELQCSAHGARRPGRISDGAVHWADPHPQVAAGQAVVAYVNDMVVGGGLAA